jgi:trans-aconitate 2-methyltransferase
VQEAWGIKLLETLPAGRYEKILDAGCGSGRLTTHLMRMFPQSQVVGLDRSAEMLEQAKQVLSRFHRRLKLIHGDLLTANPGRNFSLVFSNATFHWIRDHSLLFRNLRLWLAPGARLIAQCGGRGNLRRIEGLIKTLGREISFRKYFRGFSRPVNYAAPATTRKLLEQSGFCEIEVSLHPAPTLFASRTDFKDFIRYVICVPNLARLPSSELQESYLEAFLDLYEKQFGRSYLLDYVRLNIRAKRLAN